MYYMKEIDIKIGGCSLYVPVRLEVSNSAIGIVPSDGCYELFSVHIFGGVVEDCWKVS